jgi:hypothetical protein
VARKAKMVCPANRVFPVRRASAVSVARKAKMACPANRVLPVRRASGASGVNQERED